MITRTPENAALYVTGAQILDPASKLNQAGDLLIEKGRVAAVGKVGELSARAKSLSAATVKADGLFLAPGFVDLNCAIHEPGAEHIENFQTGSAAAAAGGFTTLLVKPLTEPVHDNAFVTDFLLRRARENSRVRIVPMGALTSGREGTKLAEVGSMAAAGIRAVGDGRGHADSYLLRKGLEYTQAFGLPVFSFPEDRVLAGQGMMNEGWNSNRLGIRGIPPAAEEIAVARDLILARHTGGRLHLQSISSRGSLDLIRQARANGLRFTAETNPAYFTLTSDAISSYDANYKVFPPLRTPEDIEAVAAALADGTLDLIASAHRPQTRSSKEQAFEHAAPGMISLETTFHLTLKLVEQKKISPLRMVELLSWAPAKVLGLEESIGSLRVGAHGDFVLFNPKGSTEFSASRIQSASRNTPFVGQIFPGILHSTYVGGTLVHEFKEKH